MPWLSMVQVVRALIALFGQQRISSTSAHADVFDPTKKSLGEGVTMGSAVWSARDEDIGAVGGPFHLGRSPNPRAMANSPLPGSRPPSTTLVDDDLEDAKGTATDSGAMLAPGATAGRTFVTRRARCDVVALMERWTCAFADGNVAHDITVLDRATFLRGHIIVCGAVSGLQHFITPLRMSTNVVRTAVVGIPACRGNNTLMRPCSQL